MSSKPSPDAPSLTSLEKLAEREKKARKEAERILEDKSRDLYQANEALKDAQAELERKIEVLEQERDRVVQLSFTDILTKLPNRTALMTRLDQQIDIRRNHVWLFLVNLRNFQFVNATIGQRGGDDVLRLMGDRLSSIALQNDGFAARISGTEFALVFDCSEQDVTGLAHELCQEISKPVSYAEREVIIEVTFAAAGTNLVEPNSDKLRLAADFALKQGRSSSSSQVSWFNGDMQALITRRQSLLGQLHDAISRDEIEAWFQPIVYPNDDSKLSLEVLARWRERGCLVSPTEFFPLVDEIGLREHLDRALLTTALKKAKPWVEAGKVHDVSINVSPQNLMTPGFAEEFERQLRSVGFPPEHVVVELTEETFIKNMEAVGDQLFALQRIGVNIALDDFGMGYSNLRSIVGLPFSKIKLDRTLIWEMESSDRVAMLVSTLIQWARASDLQIVAEGVETEMQAVLLRSLGCTSLQGYLYGRALPARLLAPRFELEEGASLAKRA